MKSLRLLLALLCLAVNAPVAHADGVVGLNWTSCTGPLNLTTTPGSVANAYVSILGQSQVSQAYECVAVGGFNGFTVVDAWRFDPTGCEGSSLFTLNHLAPSAVSKACPSFQGSLQSLQIKDYSYDVTTGKVRIVLADAYPNADANNVARGNPGAANPAQRYFLANYSFDFSFAVNGPSDPGVTCGHLEQPICFALTAASWLDLAGNEFPFTIGADFITANDPSNQLRCPGVFDAAQGTTWGRIKTQYR